MDRWSSSSIIILRWRQNTSVGLVVLASIRHCSIVDNCPEHRPCLVGVIEHSLGGSTANTAQLGETTTTRQYTSICPLIHTRSAGGNSVSSINDLDSRSRLVACWSGTQRSRSVSFLTTPIMDIFLPHQSTLSGGMILLPGARCCCCGWKMTNQFRFRVRRHLLGMSPRSGRDDGNCEERHGAFGE